jgi:hypothetical protein
MAADHEDLAADWRYPELGDYLDVDAGVPVVQGERLSVLNAQERSIALTAAEMRVEVQVAALDSRALARLAVDAVERLYRVGVSLELWSPDISAYVRATWGVVFGELAKRGFRLHYVIEHLHPERIGRPLELFPDLFAAAGFDYVCPHTFANLLPEAHEAEVTPDALAPFLPEGRRLALEQATAVAAAGRHLAYLELAPEAGAVDAVVDLIAATPGTIGVHRVGLPDPVRPPEVSLASRGPGA